MRRFSNLIRAAAISYAVVAAAIAQDKPAAEKTPAPGAGIPVGAKAPTFTAKSISGKDIKFPESYKGKLVLVDFWATWCPPCRGEVPNLVAAHTKLHGKGLEIIGISRDESHRISAEKVTEYTGQNKMPWEQVYLETTPIIRSYNVRFIPSPFLVNGDTGLVIASGDDLLGDSLIPTIEKHLSKSDGKHAERTAEKRDEARLVEKKPEEKKTVEPKHEAKTPEPKKDTAKKP